MTHEKLRWRRRSAWVVLALYASIAASPAASGEAQRSTAPAAGAPAPGADGVEGGGVDWPEVGAKTLDACVIRPLGALAMVAGAGFFAASTPFLLPSRNFSESWDVFVAAPVEYTFQRPLGEL